MIPWLVEQAPLTRRCIGGRSSARAFAWPMMKSSDFECPRHRDTVRSTGALIVGGACSEEISICQHIAYEYRLLHRYAIGAGESMINGGVKFRHVTTAASRSESRDSRNDHPRARGQIIMMPKKPHGSRRARFSHVAGATRSLFW